MIKPANKFKGGRPLATSDNYILKTSWEGFIGFTGQFSLYQFKHTLINNLNRSIHTNDQINYNFSCFF